MRSQQRPERGSHRFLDGLHSNRPTGRSGGHARRGDSPSTESAADFVQSGQVPPAPMPQHGTRRWRAVSACLPRSCPQAGHQHLGERDAEVSRGASLVRAQRRLPLLDLISYFQNGRNIFAVHVTHPGDCSRHYEGKVPPGVNEVMSRRQQILAAILVILSFAVGWWIAGKNHSTIQICAKSDANCGNLTQTPD